MRILTIRTTREGAALNDRLLAATTPEGVSRAEALLREANPGLDLSRLEPGTVVLVPDGPEFNIEHTEAVGGSVVAAEVVASPSDIAGRLVGTAADLDAAASTRDGLIRELRSRPIRQIEERLPELKPDFDRTRRALAAEAREAPVRRERLEQVIKQAAEDLAALRRRFG